MTVGEYFKNNLIVFGALCMGQIVFTLVVSMPGIAQTNSDLNDIFIWLVPTLGIVEILVFKLITRNRFDKVEGNLSSKSAEYRAIMITTWASHEGATFFAIVSYMLTSELTLLLYALGFFIAMLPEVPTKSHFIRKLRLNKGEIQIVNDDAATLI